MQFLILRTPTDEKELRREPATWKPAAETDNDAEKDASEEMQCVTPNQKDATASDTRENGMRSWPMRQERRTTLYTPRKKRQGLKTRT